MKTEKFKKGLSLFLVVLMLLSFMPAVGFVPEVEAVYPVIMAFTPASSGDFHRYYKQVYTVTFLDAVDTVAMNGALEKWDLSADGNESVMGWMYLNEDATAVAGDNRYDVYIAGEGGVGANTQSGYIFYMFESLTEVKGTENFKTSDATSLKALFYKCYSLKSVDLSSWDTSNVTTMNQLFDMTTVTGSTIVPALERVDLTGWNTDKVTDMSYMFNNCKSIDQLDLSSFNTEKVTNMQRMFYLCMSLENIYVGDGWTVESVNNANAMFNCCYAIVGGKETYDKDFQYIPPGKEYAKLKEEGGFLTYKAPEVVLPEKYTVTYEFIGDIIPEGVTAPDAATYEEGETVTVAGPSSAEQYIFSGWTTEDAEVVNGEFVINNDVEFVGSWTKLYKVTYEYDDTYDLPPVYPELPDVEYWYAPGEDVPVYGVPYAPDYIFVGWKTGDAEIIGDSFLMPENDVVIYGYYKMPVNSIEISGGELTVDIGGEKVKVEVIVDPPNATFKDVIFESGDENIVTVDKDGYLTPEGVGTTTITITSVDDPSKTDTVNVTVKIPVTDITVDRNEIDLNKGEEDKITVTEVKPVEATNKDVTYESSNPEVVTVDEDGNIIAVGDGTAIITVTSKDNKTVKERVTVTVKTPVTDITVPENDITVKVGDEQNIGAKVTPEDATYPELTYESDNPGVVKIDKDGNIIAVGEGEATITITSKDNPNATETVKVTVKIPVTDITVDKTNVELPENGKGKVTVTVTPDNATDKGVTYESSDETVVKVDEKGNIEAVGEGEATITVTSKDNPNATETVTVTVYKEYKVTYSYVGDVIPVPAPLVPASSVYRKGETVDVAPEAVANGYTFSGWTTNDAEVTNGEFVINNDVHFIGSWKKNVVSVDAVDKVTLAEGDKTKIEVTVLPEDATEKGVIFGSSDETVVKVDEKGNVEAVGEGEATITVTSKDDPTISETITVTVEKKPVPVEKVEVEKDEFTLIEGDTDTIKVIVTPDDADNKKVTYTSSDETVVKVDENGNIEAVKEGTATITVTTEDGKKTATVTVTVEKNPVHVEDVTVDRPVIELTEGDKDKITVTVTPDDADDKTVTFESSDETVVKVDEKGNIEAVGEGEATITITSKDDPTKKETVTVKVEKKEEPADPEDPDIPEEPEEPEYVIEVVDKLEVKEGITELIYVKVTPNDGSLRPTFSSADESIARVDEFGNVTGIAAGTTTIYVNFPNGEIRPVIVTVIAPAAPSIPTVPKTHYVCFGKTDGIGWYEVSINGGDFFPQGPNSTLEVEEGSILVVRVQDMWIDDEFDFYVNGKKVPLDPANTITVVVDGYMLIGALSMDVEVPDVDESLTLFQRIIRAIKEFFGNIGDWFKKLFS